MKEEKFQSAKVALDMIAEDLRRMKKSKVGISIVSVCAIACRFMESHIMHLNTNTGNIFTRFFAKINPAYIGAERFLIHSMDNLYATHSNPEFRYNDKNGLRFKVSYDRDEHLTFSKYGDDLILLNVNVDTLINDTLEVIDMFYDFCLNTDNIAYKESYVELL